jgi:hypothetical protein
MPIVFHFNTSGDPSMKVQLRPVGFERYASPLILRPIPDGKGFRTAALVLASDLPAAELVAGQSVHPVKSTLDMDMARQITALHRNGKVYVDPLELFLWELKK